jgi:hypothetical protein
MGESIHRTSTTGERPDPRHANPTPFHAHIELLQLFLARRVEIVERIEQLVNAQRKPAQYLKDASLLRRHFDDCLFTLAGVSREQLRLKSQLEEAHWASGFKPRQSPGMYNDLVDPAEMMVRGFYLWQQTHWPGHNGRVRFAHTLFHLYVIHKLALLSMRLWDGSSSDVSDEAENRLSQIQSVLDPLWKTSPPDQPVLVRDARWLIPMAMSPTTNELYGYFVVVENIAATLSEEDRVEIQKATVQLAGGHLRTQLRHVSVKRGVSLEDNGLIRSTRTTNALDLALLIQCLAPLLAAYEHAIHNNGKERIALADAICQGISPDPELFLNRLELLGPYSMIEHLFINDRDEHVSYTPMGQRHIHIFQEYASIIRRLATPLLEDCRHFNPVDGAYSPFGVLYGYSYNLIDLIALKSLRPDVETHFSLEDAFTNGGSDKRAWANSWRKLPHIKPEVTKLFEYPQNFAEEMFARIESALRRCVSRDEANTTTETGRLYIVPENGLQRDSIPSTVSDLPAKFIWSSDAKFAATHEADPCDETQLLLSRQEGEFLLSYKASAGWVALSKDLLTEVLGAGRSVKIAGLPNLAAQVLMLMCPNLVVFPGR